MNSTTKMGTDNRLHKLIERQRRKDMKTGVSVLRSLLPHEYIMGSRSVEDQVEAAIGYINHLKKQIYDLGKKREVLKLSPKYDLHEKNYKILPFSCGSDPLSKVEIIPVGSGIVISTNTLKHEVLLSDILLALENDGLEVISAMASTTEEKVFYTICAEVSALVCFDNTNLHLKLCCLISRNMSAA